MSKARPVMDGGDWAKPPAAAIRLTPALEDAMLEGIRYELCPIIQVEPERKIVGFDLVPMEAVPGPSRAEEGEP